MSHLLQQEDKELLTLRGCINQAFVLLYLDHWKLYILEELQTLSNHRKESLVFEKNKNRSTFKIFFLIMTTHIKKFLSNDIQHRFRLVGFLIVWIVVLIRLHLFHKSYCLKKTLSTEMGKRCQKSGWFWKHLKMIKNSYIKKN